MHRHLVANLRSSLQAHTARPTRARGCLSAGAETSAACIPRGRPPPCATPRAVPARGAHFGSVRRAQHARPSSAAADARRPHAQTRLRPPPPPLRRGGARSVCWGRAGAVGAAAAWVCGDAPAGWPRTRRPAVSPDAGRGDRGARVCRHARPPPDQPARVARGARMRQAAREPQPASIGFQGAARPESRAAPGRAPRRGTRGRRDLQAVTRVRRGRRGCADAGGRAARAVPGAQEPACLKHAHIPAARRRPPGKIRAAPAHAPEPRGGVSRRADRARGRRRRGEGNSRRKAELRMARRFVIACARVNM